MVDKLKYNFSFAGCGFLGIYHVGVTTCLKQYAPHLTVHKVSGASAGAIAAALLLCDAPMEEITKTLLEASVASRAKILGPFSPSFNITKILRSGFQKILPPDAHLRCNGRLHISMTRIHDYKNVIASHFESREELIEAIMCATFIPLFSGFLAPKYRGDRHMDGGFTDNCPLIDDYTISVVPYCGEADICPKDGQLGTNLVSWANTSFEVTSKNFFRLASTFFPPSPEVLLKICKQGFEDCLKFLIQRELLLCSTCIPTLQATLNNTKNNNYDKNRTINTYSEDKNLMSIPRRDSCVNCTIYKEEAMQSRLPDSVKSTLKEAAKLEKSGIFNKLNSYSGVKFLSVMTLPWALSADIAVAAGQKIIETAPNLLILAPDGVRKTLVSLIPIQKFKNSDMSDDNVSFIPFIRGDLLENGRILLETESVISIDDMDINSGPVIIDENMLVSLSRRGSAIVIEPEDDNESFERWLNVAAHQDNVVSYYYSNN